MRLFLRKNVPQYNPEWQHSPNRRATSYLVTLVCRYMHESQQKYKKVVLSAKALETIYHTARSLIGKLISGRQYLGGYTLEQVRDKVEAGGKELPFRKKKLPQRSTGLTRTSSSVMEHWKEKRHRIWTGEYQERSQESWFGVKSIKFGKGNLKKITVSASEYWENSQKPQKMYRNYVKKDLNAHLKTKLQGETANVEKNFRNRVWCDACWLWFGTLSIISSPQSSAITTRKVPDSLRCLWHKSTEIVWESTWEMMNAWKQESANDTTSTAQRQDLDKETSTDQEHNLESQHISAKYIRYFKAAHGGSRLQ